MKSLIICNLQAILQISFFILSGVFTPFAMADEITKPKEDKDDGTVKKKEEKLKDEKTNKPEEGKKLLLQNGINGYKGCEDGCFFVDHPPAKRRDRLELETKKNFVAGLSVKFDLSSTNLSDPDDIDSATLILYAMRQSRSGGKARIQLRTGQWIQSDGHAKIKTMIGEDITYADFKDYRKDKKHKINPPIAIKIDISKAVRIWIKDPKSNHGIVMTPAKSVDIFFHSIKVRNPDYRPALEIQLKKPK